MNDADINNGKHFTRQLMLWHATANNRSLPWKSEKDPYRIWLSEVILQQTRAQQGLPYYLRFIEAYPRIEDMAAAGEEQVFRIWQGLGYYNRCRNMLATARYITTALHGKFPDTYEGLLSLKGIGPYTAAAIGSFAFGLPCSVVDGNVYRVLARYFGIDTPTDTTVGKKQFATLAQQLLDATDSAAYNQAIMDLGATVCTPRNPQCGSCPLQPGCMAYHHDLASLLPVKSKKTAVRTRYFHYLLLHWEGQLWMQKRTAKDIWAGLHEPYLVETGQPMDVNELLLTEPVHRLGLRYTSVTFEDESKQRLTHQVIAARFFSVYLTGKPAVAGDSGRWVPAGELGNIALPKTVLSFLEKNIILLELIRL